MDTSFFPEYESNYGNIPFFRQPIIPTTDYSDQLLNILHITSFHKITLKTCRYFYDSPPPPPPPARQNLTCLRPIILYFDLQGDGTLALQK